MLAHAFHTTPWEWRGESAPSLEDYATSVHLLEQIAEESRG